MAASAASVLVAEDTVISKGFVRSSMNMFSWAGLQGTTMDPSDMTHSETAPKHRNVDAGDFGIEVFGFILDTRKTPPRTVMLECRNPNSNRIELTR